MVENFDRNILINLLPRELIEKRRSEKYLVVVATVFAALLGLLIFFFAVNYARVSASQRQLDTLVQENSRFASAIDKIEEFESRKALVDEGRKLLEKVSVNEFEWSRFLNNVSLIVPSDIWLQSISGDQEKIILEGAAPSAEDTTTEMGHTAVAKWLVHLSEVSTLDEVWLDSSDKVTDDKKPVPQVNFKTTALIKGYQPEDAVSKTRPAPPAVPGGTPQ